MSIALKNTHSALKELLLHLLYLFSYSNRVTSTVILTARSIASALSTSPESSSAYESSDSMLSMIHDSKEQSKLQENGSKKMVSSEIFS